jgi:hypothetical protein
LTKAEGSAHSLKERAEQRLFQNYGFHLLTSARDDVRIGDVYEGSENSTDIRFVDRLEEFIKPKNIVPTPRFEYPTMTRNAKVQDYKGVESQISDTRVALEFFKGLFNRIKQGFGASLSSKFTSKRILNAAYVFINNNADRVSRNSLSRSLENFIFGRYYSANKQYFVVTQVYRSKEVHC